MKKFISLTFVILLVFSCFMACSNNAQPEQGNSNPTTDSPTQAPTQVSTPVPTPNPTPTPVPKWYVHEYKDDFGDPTGDKGVFGEFQGEYSKTTSGVVNVSASILAHYYEDDGKPEHFMFELFKYGTVVEKLRNESLVSCKLKIGADKYSATLITSGKWFYLCESWQGTKISLNKGIVDKLYRALQNNEEVAWVVSFDDCKYEFVIDGSGFKDACRVVYP